MSSSEPDGADAAPARVRHVADGVIGARRSGNAQTGSLCLTQRLGGVLRPTIEFGRWRAWLLLSRWLTAGRKRPWEGNDALSRWDDGAPRRSEGMEERPDGIEGEGDTAPTRRGVHRSRHRHPKLRAAAIVAGILVVVLALAGGIAVWKLNGNVKRVDVSKALGTDRPTPKANTKAAQALNILVLGSDTRTDLESKEFGEDTVEGGAHSDTNILIHISADRKRVQAVSIPRDSMVPAPKKCSATAPKEEWVVRQWNYNYNEGGPGCTIRALEGNTGIYIDHYAVLNFEGFASMVDALGGVEVCTPVAIRDEAASIALEAGRHTLMGMDALGYVRARKSLTGGSDINRIKRQQAFMSSVAQKAVSTEMLKRPDKLYSFLSAATKALTTDQNLGLSEMTEVARSLQNVGPENIEFLTVPIEPYPADSDRVQWSANADIVWASLRNDTRIGAPAPTPSASPRPSVTAADLTVTPDRITVEVLNGSGVKGVAKQAAEALRVQGFANVTTADAARGQGVTIEHSRAQAEAARTVAAAFPGATLRENAALGDTVRVTLGVESPAVVAVPNRLGTDPIPTPTVTASPSPDASGSTPTIETRTADENICS
jgi:LCP family protein required for cell wall assembly